MRRALDDSMLATGPLVAALAVAVHPLAGLLVAAVLIAGLALGRRRRAIGAPVVTMAALQPRRPAARPAISVAAIARTGPGVRALTAAELPAAHVRRADARVRSLDAPLLAACWDVATRRNARLTDARAERLGLADGPLARRGQSADPDPVLLAATWPIAA